MDKRCKYNSGANKPRNSVFEDTCQDVVAVLIVGFVVVVVYCWMEALQGRLV